MLKRHKPPWLYESLPYLYLAVGLMTMVLLRNAMAMLAGLVLVMAGALVLAMRRQSRMRVTGSAPSAQARVDAVVTTKFVRLMWRSAYECGNATIDAQHLRLFELGNELIDAVQAYLPHADIEQMLENFLYHLIDHFCTEETILASAGHPLSGEHQQVHRRLLERGRGLCERQRNGDLSQGDLVAYLTTELIAEHIAGEDLEFMSHRDEAWGRITVTRSLAQSGA